MDGEKGREKSVQIGGQKIHQVENTPRTKGGAEQIQLPPEPGPLVQLSVRDPWVDGI